MGGLGIYAAGMLLTMLSLLLAFKLVRSKLRSWLTVILLPWVQLLNVRLVSFGFFVALMPFLSMMNLLPSI